MKITKVYVKRLSGRQRLLGVASVVFDDCFKVRDILILPRNENERYISMQRLKPEAQNRHGYIEKVMRMQRIIMQ